MTSLRDTTGDNPEPYLPGPEDLYEADFNPSRFLDVDTGKIADLREAMSQMATLRQRGELDTALTFASDKLAESEDLADQIFYAGTISQTAELQGKPEVMLHYAILLEEQGRKLDLWQLVASGSALQAEAHTAKGELERARGALKEAFLQYATAQERPLQGKLQQEANYVAQGNLKHAELEVFQRLVEAGMLKELRQDVAERLETPIADDEPIILYRALADGAVAERKPGLAIEHVGTAEWIAADAGNLLAAADSALIQARLALSAYGGSGSGRSALDRAITYLGGCREGGYDPQELGEVAGEVTQMDLQLRLRGF